MKQAIKTVWKGDMAFETDLMGHKLIVDAGEENGGHDLGPRPKILMLAALRWPSQRANVTDEPRFQASSLKGPVPTGCSCVHVLPLVP